MSDDAPQMFDTVKTPDGNATVVGLLPETGQVEVRYASRNLLIWPASSVKVIEEASTPATSLTAQVVAQTPADAYRQARESGAAPVVDPTAFGEDVVPTQPAETKGSTIARLVGEQNQFVGKDGRPLKGVALRNAQAKAKRDQS
jgi:hypothetical protein